MGTCNSMVQSLTVKLAMLTPWYGHSQLQHIYNAKQIVDRTKRNSRLFTRYRPKVQSGVGSIADVMVFVHLDLISELLVTLVYKPGDDEVNLLSARRNVSNDLRGRQQLSRIQLDSSLRTLFPPPSSLY